MDGLSFSELWEKSKAFRSLFFYNKVLTVTGRMDLGKAEFFWAERFPKTKWNFCGFNGCSSLSIAGEYCHKHQLEECGKMASFKWYKGHLMKYISEHRHDNKKGKIIYEYRYVDQNIWLRTHCRRGKIPSGYVIRPMDGNPFNNHHSNLVLISKVSAAAYDAGVIGAAEAIDLDSSLPESVIRRIGPGRPSARWVYGTEAIGKVAGIPTRRVRQDIARGAFDPEDLASVVDFCKKRAEGVRMVKGSM